MSRDGLERTSLRDVPADDRPREKLIRLGPAVLGDNELVAIVLGQGTRETNALDLANLILADSGGTRELTRLSCDDLAGRRGMGPAKAARLLAAVELGRRTLMATVSDRPRIGSARAAAAYLLPRYGAGRVERFGVVLLDTRHRVVRASILTVGTLDASLVHPREVFREAIAGSASAVLLFHNHPSGDPSPSPEDVALTERLVGAGRVVGIDVVDHVILAEASYFSFKERQRL